TTAPGTFLVRTALHRTARHPPAPRDERGDPVVAEGRDAPEAERQVRMTTPLLERAAPRPGGVGLRVMTRTDPAPSPDAGLPDPASTARGSAEAEAPDAGAPDFDLEKGAPSPLGPLFGGALRKSPNPPDAEDPVQETFVKAF